MSIEMHVFFRGKLPDKRQLSRAMADLGFPLTIAAGSLERQRGFMPMRLRREEAGVEFDVYNERAAVEEIAGDDFDPRFERCANFRWAGDEYEMLSGMCAAAALAKLVNGTVLDGEAGKLLSVEEAIALAQETLQATLKPEDTRRGTRPADLRRYLKPLLRQRSDLVLIGRMLLIRPVRHILRGALLKRGSKGYILTYTCMNLLCHTLGTTGNDGGIHKGMLYIWKPHFEPSLMDTLAEDIFEDVGKITSLDDFAAALPDEDLFPRISVTALYLSGQRERAAARLQQIESRSRNNPYWRPWYEAQRDLLTRDIGEICALYHEREAETVKELKLGRIWEPSPFQVELPADQRKQRSDEPLFIPNPWTARPRWLLGDLPEQVGDVRFAKEWLRRKGRRILVVPLSRDQAEDRHQNFEHYVLAARLAGGLLLLLRWDGQDRLDPDRIASSLEPAYYVSDLRLELRGSDFVVEASFDKRRDIEGVVMLRSMRVHRHRARWPSWSWSFDRDDGEKRIWDRRSGEQVFTREPLTNTDRLTLPQLNFGEFDPLVQIVLTALRSEGFGEIT